MCSTHNLENSSHLNIIGERKYSSSETVMPKKVRNVLPFIDLRYNAHQIKTDSR
jgi:hypothetical protein